MADNDGCASGGCGCLIFLAFAYFVLPFLLQIIMAICGFLLGILG